MDEDDVVGLGSDSAKGIGDRMLAMFAALHKLNFFAQNVSGLGLQAFTEAGDFVFAEGNHDLANRGTRGEFAQGVNQNGSTA